MMDERLPELPKGWVWTRLGEVCLDPQYGWTTSAVTNGRLRLLRTTDITSGIIDWDSLPFCKEEPSEKEKYLLNDGDVVISRAGSIGHSILIKNPKETIFASYLIRFKPLVNKSYFSYFLKSPFYWASILEKSLGIAIPNINASKLRQIPFPLAPFNEQHRIVAKIEELFTRLDAGVEALKKIKAQLKRYRQAVLKYAFEGKLTQEWREANRDKLESASVLLERIKEERKAKLGKKYKELPPIDTSELPGLPGGWVWARLGDISEINSGFGFPIIYQGINYGEIPFYKVADISKNILKGNIYLKEADNYISREICGKLKAVPLKTGSIVFAKIGEAIKLNRRAILSEESLVDNNVMGIYPIREIAYNLFSYYFLLTIKLGDLSRATTVPSIRKSDVEQVPFPLPPLPEQHKIVEEIESRFSVADEIEKVVDQSLKQAERLRQSILKRAFEGKLVPQDPTDEPAEKLLERIKREKESQNSVKQKSKRRK